MTSVILIAVCIVSLYFLSVMFWQMPTRNHNNKWSKNKAYLNYREPTVSSSSMYNDLEFRMQKVMKVQQKTQKSIEEIKNVIRTMDREMSHIRRSTEDGINETRKLLEDSMSASEIQSLKAEFDKSIESLKQTLNCEVGQFKQRADSLESELRTLNLERHAKRSAVVISAQEKINTLINEATSTLPCSTTRLLDALLVAGDADTLPQLKRVGQRLLSDICSSTSGDSVHAYIETRNKLSEIHEELEKLLTSASVSVDTEQRSDRLSREAESVFAEYSDKQHLDALDSVLIEEAHQTLLREIGMPYISIVMGRFQGDGDRAYSQICLTLKNLGLELIDIVIGQTRPDSRLHDVQSAVPVGKYPLGTIANVIKMGYIETDVKKIFKAQVMVTQ